MKKHFIIGSIFSLLIVALLGASNIPQSWTWDKTAQWFSVLMKDGGGTKFVAAAPKQYFATSGSDSSCSATLSTIKICGTAGTSWSLQRGVLIPYKTQEGAWRLKYNIVGTVSSASRTSFSLFFDGVKNKNTANFYQPVAAMTNGGATYYSCYADVGVNSVSFYHSAAATTVYGFSGDIELDSKPTWADAN